jgi:hypothetical protein
MSTKLIETLVSNEALTSDDVQLLIEEAERALLTVEARVDEPGRRTLNGDVPDRDDQDAAADEISELRLAMAELVDAFPGIAYDLESIGERMRNVGAKAAGGDLEGHTHVLDLVRMSLEVFFRSYPTVEAYELDQKSGPVAAEDLAQTPAEIYDAYRELRAALRARLS